MAGNQKTDAHSCFIDDALIGKRVKIARKEKWLTQKEFAKLCDCTPTHMCNIENGEIGISMEQYFHTLRVFTKTHRSFLCREMNRKEISCWEPHRKTNC